MFSNSGISKLFVITAMQFKLPFFNKKGLLLCAGVLFVVGYLSSTVKANGAAAVAIENNSIKVSFNEQDGLISVYDKRSHHLWKQANTISNDDSLLCVPCKYAVFGKPAIDGSTRGWDISHPIVIGEKGKGVYGKAYLMWDSTHLYVMVKVTDEKVISVPAGRKEFWNSDSLEIRIGKNLLTCVITSPNAGFKPILRLYWYKEIPSEPVVSNLDITEKGYLIQVEIPLEKFPYLSKGISREMQVPFALAINNAEVVGKRKEQKCFPKKSGYDLTAFSTLTFIREEFESVKSSRQKIFTQKLKSIDESKKVITLTGHLPGRNKRGDVKTCEFLIQLSLGLCSSDLDVAFESRAHEDLIEVTYPYAFYLAEPDSYVVFPHAEGVLLPVREKSPGFLDIKKDLIYSGYGPYCACIGLVNLASGVGALTIYETPELAGYKMGELTIADEKIIAPVIVWKSNKYHFSRNRKVIFSFVDNGAYVTLAKRYRRYFKNKGLYKSLVEKAKDNPCTDKVIGAPVFWVVGNLQQVLDVARMMHKDGLKKAVFEVAYPYHHTSGEDKSVAGLEDIVNEIKSIGYVVSRYDAYRECFKKDPNASVYEQLNTDAYPALCSRSEDGELCSGWPGSFLLNSELALGLAQKHIPDDLKRYHYNGRFLDTLGSCTFLEGVDWDLSHPLDAYGVLHARTELAKYVNSLGLVLGTEGGIDCYLQYFHWLETPMSLVKWASVGLQVPSVDEQKDFPEYQVSISTKYRIPFYSLVHHDEIMSTWRWEDGFNVFPQYWQQKNLWSVLYGNTPMFFLDRKTYLKWRKEIAHTYQYVCKWAQKIGYDEMVSHKFITKDKTIQESLFSSMNGVVANFSNIEYQLPDGRLIQPRSYLTFKEGKKRQYFSPPVKEIDYSIANRVFENVAEDFEEGHLGKFITTVPFNKKQSAYITSDSSLVIAGRYSFVAENKDPDSEWNDMLISNPDLIPFKPGGTYKIGFDYRVLKFSPEKKMYAVAKSATGGLDSFVEAGLWYPESDKSGRIENTVTLKNYDDYFICWGIQGAGKLLLDNIVIEEVKMKEILL